jgi:SAM-dependent methyltransferase
MLQSHITKIDRWRYQLVSSYCIGKVLDVGCGLGGLRQFLAPERYLGCDFSGGDMHCSAYELPFDDGGFDTVVLCEILEHLGLPQRAVEEAARVSARRVIVTVPNDYSLVRLARLLMNRDVEIEPEHIISYNRWNIRQLFAPLGFKPVASFCYPLRLQLMPEIPIRTRFGSWLFVIMDKVR